MKRKDVVRIFRQNMENLNSCDVEDIDNYNAYPGNDNCYRNDFLQSNLLKFNELFTFIEFLLRRLSSFSVVVSVCVLRRLQRLHVFLATEQPSCFVTICHQFDSAIIVAT